MNPNVHLTWVDSDAERRAWLAARPEAMLVSASLPLRANLSVLENIALVPQYRENLDFARAAERAWALLVEAGYEGCAERRDPDLTSEERCVALLARAVIAQAPIIVIERPALLLPDTHYPAMLERLLDRLAHRLNVCWILDYTWNAPLYAPRT